MAGERTYAAITLDLILPDTSGLDVLRALRSEGKNQAVPVVVITVVSEKTAVESMVSEILKKPLDGVSLWPHCSESTWFPDTERIGRF